jgi:hypothetical protein
MMVCPPRIDNATRQQSNHQKKIKARQQIASVHHDDCLIMMVIDDGKCQTTSILIDSVHTRYINELCELSHSGIWHVYFALIVQGMMIPTHG